MADSRAPGAPALPFVPVEPFLAQPLPSEELSVLHEQLRKGCVDVAVLARWEQYLVGLESFLKSRLRGQDSALETLARSLCRVEIVGLRKGTKPKGSFFFVGPTGIGKTESTKLTVQYLYGTDKTWRDGGNFALFDMGEFAEEGSIAQLLGRNREEQGVLGDAMDALNSRGGGVMLFDEIEKAHITVAKMMLGLLDDARVTMKNGSVKRATEMYFVFTSNIGAMKAAELKKSPPPTIKRIMVAAAQKHFGPEFIARFSATVVFMRLPRDVQVEICRDYMPNVCDRVISRRGLRGLDYDEDALQALAAQAYSLTAGARFVMTTLDREVGDAVLAWLPRQKTPHPYLRLTTDSRSKALVCVERPPSLK